MQILSKNFDYRIDYDDYFYSSEIFTFRDIYIIKLDKTRWEKCKNTLKTRLKKCKPMNKTRLKKCKLTKELMKNR